MEFVICLLQTIAPIRYEKTIFYYKSIFIFIYNKILFYRAISSKGTCMVKGNTCGQMEQYMRFDLVYLILFCSFKFEIFSSIGRF